MPGYIPSTWLCMKRGELVLFPRPRHADDIYIRICDCRCHYHKMLGNFHSYKVIKRRGNNGKCCGNMQWNGMRQ